MRFNDFSTQQSNILSSMSVSVLDVEQMNQGGLGKPETFITSLEITFAEDAALYLKAEFTSDMREVEDTFAYEYGDERGHHVSTDVEGGIEVYDLYIDLSQYDGSVNTTDTDTATALALGLTEDDANNPEVMFDKFTELAGGDTALFSAIGSALTSDDSIRDYSTKVLD